MSELLERIHGEIRARLAVSAAAVRESARLETALAALDGVAPGAERSRPAASRGARPRGPGGAAKRAPRGANRAAALRVIGARPGIGAGDLVAATGINRPVLYALLSRLVDQGEIVKHAPGKGPAGYALASVSLTPEPPAVAGTSPAVDDHAEPQADTGTPGETSPAAAPSASETTAGGETPAMADGSPSTVEESAAPDQPVTSSPEPRRRAAKPRGSSRAPRRAKPKPKPAA